MSARPMLAEVLGVVLGEGFVATVAAPRPIMCRSTLALLDVPRAMSPSELWRHTAPADAVEALIARGLLPEHWSDEGRAPRWWCAGCEGRGHVCCRCATPCGPSPFDFVSDGTTAAPPSHPALVAVAALGLGTLARAEAIVAETWRARVVWRVMTADALREHHGQRAFAASASPRAEEAFSWEAHIAERDNRPWRTECPFGEEWGAEIQRTWPASTALRALGVHLLAVNESRVVIGVEALG